VAEAATTTAAGRDVRQDRIGLVPQRGGMLQARTGFCDYDGRTGTSVPLL